MVLLTASAIKKSFTEKPLLSSVDLTINSSDKIGLVGVNGTGKTTLLKIIAGEYDAEGGDIIRSRDLRSAYLPQNPKFDQNLSVIDQAIKYLNESGKSFQQYQCEKMLTKLGIDDFMQPMGELSGGQRKRVAMAAVLALDSNLLILDEPTNHMDNEIISWLEGFLINYNGAVFMITHDRYFLDRITNRIMEIENGQLYAYEGNYDYYLNAKSERLKSNLASERKRQTIYRKELEWIRRGAQARSTKAKGRIDRFNKLADNKFVVSENTLDLTTASSRLGRKIIEIENISKSYDDNMLFKDFTYTVLRNDRVGIVGSNGCGKSTLLNVIMRKLEPDSGTVDIGDTVKIGYFSQENQKMDPNQRVIKFISEIAENINISEGNFSASQMLERFLFPPYMHSVEVGRLSGGEKRRLYLLSILMRAPNVLILDEPTNDLDIDTLTILEDYLDDFQGAVIVVSHDRYMLDRIVRKTFAFDGEGNVSMYNGGYSDYTESLKEEILEKQKKIELMENSEHSKNDESTGRVNVKTNRDGSPKKLKFSYTEKREFETIEDEIQKIEEKISSLELEMSKTATDFVKLSELSNEKNKNEEQLTEKMMRWEYLTELAEKIEIQ